MAKDEQDYAMAKLVDLTRPLVTLDRNNFPPALAPLFRIISPEIDFVGNDRGADIMCEIFSCPKTDLPEEEGWAEEMITLSSHLGTHVDAPLHYGSTCGGAPSKTIDQIPLDELYCDAVVLDMTHKKGTADAITVDDLKRALEAVQYRIKEGDAVLIRTDHDKFALDDPMRYNYPGMVRESALYLAECGAKIGGTDALGWDRPFAKMVEQYHESKDKSHIWDAHFAYRDIEVYVVQQLVNLEKLPPHGFKVAFFPILLVGTSAAPARVVAFI
jgi:kynurenine formamidase